MQFTAELSMDNFSEDGGDNSTQFSSGLQTHHDNSEEEHSTFSFEEKQFFILFLIGASKSTTWNLFSQLSMEYPQGPTNQINSEHQLWKMPIILNYWKRNIHFLTMNLLKTPMFHQNCHENILVSEQSVNNMLASQISPVWLKTYL